MRVRMTLAAAVAASLTLGACASAGGNGAGLSSPLSSTSTVSGRSLSGGSSGVAAEPTVRVQNQHWSDVVVYAVRSGRRHRLGMVTSMSSARFRLPRGLSLGTGDLQLVVDPIGSSRGFTSEPINVGAGQDIALSVQNHLPMSTVSLWNHR